MLALADPDLDNGPRTDRSATMRMCAVSREVRPIDELIRFVVAPSGEVIADLKRKLPGRGLWVSASRRTVAEAVRRHQFSKGFKRDVRVTATLAADTEALDDPILTVDRLVGVLAEEVGHRLAAMGTGFEVAVDLDSAADTGDSGHQPRNDSSACGSVPLGEECTDEPAPLLIVA